MRKVTIVYKWQGKVRKTGLMSDLSIECTIEAFQDAFPFYEVISAYEEN